MSQKKKKPSRSRQQLKAENQMLRRAHRIQGLTLAFVTLVKYGGEMLRAIDTPRFSNVMDSTALTAGS